MRELNSMDIWSLLQTMIIAIFSGLGTAVGTYFAQKGFLKRFERLRKRLRKNGMGK